MTTPDHVVVADGLHRTHGCGATKVAAVRNLTVRIERATFTVVLGASGAGKTTLLHLLAGLEQPDVGTVTVGGVDLASLDEAARTVFRRRYIGLVFQHSELVPYLTARSNLVLPYVLDKRDPDPAWMDRLARALRIDDRLDQLPAQLSGGEEQRVALGRALATRPEVLIADEPHGNLDVRQGHEVLRLLRSATDRFGQTVILATHDHRSIAYADRVLVLADGELAHDVHQPDPGAVLELLAS
ncbi:MAG TPA: ABC transporter ATP-binding protein [Aquihabitans sp.]|jgi:putative ABC transport system ATP-binding protein|nr:ABC transporter ATP-binding protein [Aquihabitans sp.]